MTRALVMLAGAFVACGGPLDRIDGAIRIELLEVPGNTNNFEVTVRAGGREFSERVQRTAGDTIDTFSAIPVGPATITVRALVHDLPLASRVNVPVEVKENQTQTVRIPFAGGPEVDVLSPQDGLRYRAAAGSIPIIVQARDLELPTDLSITIGRRELPVTTEGAQWRATLDPDEVVLDPPKTLVIEIQACAAGDKTACTDTSISVQIDRSVWGVADKALASARASYSPIREGSVIYGDAEGKLFVLSATSGVQRFAPIQLAGPLHRATLAAGPLAVAIDALGVMHAYEIADGSFAWSADLGAIETTNAVFDETTGIGRILVGAGPRLLEIETINGTRREISVMTATIAATPYVDAFGVIAGDQSGLVRFFDPTNTLVDELQVGTEIVVQPIRDGAYTWVVSRSGRSTKVFRAGDANMTAIPLSSRPTHDPVRAGSAIVIAHGEEITFIEGSMSQTLLAGGAITFAPIAWPNGQAALIGIHRPALLKVISDSGEQRVVSRTQGPPLSGVLLDAPLRAFVPANTGALEMYELGEGFF